VVIKEGVKAFVIGCYNCCKLLLLVCWFVVSWLVVVLLEIVINCSCAL
jgi:hypothetical protein